MRIITCNRPVGAVNSSNAPNVEVIRLDLAAALEDAKVDKSQAACLEPLKVES